MPKGSVVAVALMACSAAGIVRAAPDDPSPKEIARRLMHSTAFVQTPAGSGTAWVLDRGRRLLVTNLHVVFDPQRTSSFGDKFLGVAVYDRVVLVFPAFDGSGRPISERSYYAGEENLKRLGAEGRAVAARVIDADMRRDLAILAVDALPADAAEVPLAADSPEPGERVHAVGNPGRSASLWNYRQGSVRSVSQNSWRSNCGRFVLEHDARIIQTQAPDNGGDSGGPVVNDRGELVGVTQSGVLDADLINSNIDVGEVRGYVGEVGWMADARSAPDLTRRARHYLDRNRVALALADAEEAVRLAPADADALLARAAACRASGAGLGARAVPDCDAAVRLRPDLARAYAERGWSRVGSRVYSAGAAVGAKADPPSFLGQARLRALGIPDRDPAAEEEGLRSAEADGRKAVELDPRSVLGHRTLARVLACRGDFAGAFRAQGEALRLTHGDVSSQEARRRYLAANRDDAVALLDDADTLLERSLIASTGGHLDAALSDCEVVMAVAQAANDGAVLLIDRGTAYRLMEKARVAIEWRRIFHHSQGNRDEEIRDLSALIAFRPEDPSPWLIRGGLALELGKYDDAIADLSQGMARDRRIGFEPSSAAIEQRGDAHAAKARLAQSRGDEGLAGDEFGLARSDYVAAARALKDRLRTGQVVGFLEKEFGPDNLKRIEDKLARLPPAPR